MSEDPTIQESSTQAKWQYWLEDYWDIILGVIAIVFAIVPHKSGNGYLATLLAALVNSATSLGVRYSRLRSSIFFRRLGGGGRLLVR